VALKQDVEGLNSGRHTADFRAAAPASAWHRRLSGS